MSKEQTKVRVVLPNGKQFNGIVTKETTMGKMIYPLQDEKEQDTFDAMSWRSQWFSNKFIHKK